MLNGFTEILTEASVGYIGLYRDEETHQPHSYYCKLPPNIADAEVILIDPMLATGGSAADAADELKKAGAIRLRFACLIAAPEGVAAFEERHPDIPIFIGCPRRASQRKCLHCPRARRCGGPVFRNVGVYP